LVNRRRVFTRLLRLRDSMGPTSERPHNSAPRAGKRCLVCRTAWPDIEQTGQVGCLYDYAHFKDRLLPALETRHGETEHVGQRPEYLSGPQGELDSDRVRIQRAIQDALSQSGRPKYVKLCESLQQLEREASSPAQPSERQ